MTSFKRLVAHSERLIQKLVDYSGLDRWLVENIIQYANQLPKNKGEDIDHLIFMAQMSKQFDINSINLIQNMFETLKAPKSPTMTVEEYCKCICLFMSDNLEAKIDYVFRVYDFNKDGLLDWTELHTLLRPCILSIENAEESEAEDSLRDLVDMVFKMTDMDLNGMIDKTEFARLVHTNILFLQMLGPCIPKEHAVQSFRSRLAGKTAFQVKLMFADERYTSLNELKPRPKEMNLLYPFPLDLPN